MISLGARPGLQMVIVSKSGLNTANAAVRVKHRRVDAVEYCSDGGTQKADAACIREAMRTPPDTTLRGNCISGAFSSFGRRLRFDGLTPGGETRERPKYRVVEVATGRPLTTATADSYFTVMDVFRALCPARAPAVGKE